MKKNINDLYLESLNIKNKKSKPSINNENKLFSEKYFFSEIFKTTFFERKGFYKRLR